MEQGAIRFGVPVPVRKDQDCPLRWAKTRKDSSEGDQGGIVRALYSCRIWMLPNGLLQGGSGRAIDFFVNKSAGCPGIVRVNILPPLSQMVRLDDFTRIA